MLSMAIKSELLVHAKQLPMNDWIMKPDDEQMDDELRPEYDLKRLKLRKVGPGRKHSGFPCGDDGSGAKNRAEKDESCRLGRPGS